jgi:hypothetical protein
MSAFDPNNVRKAVSEFTPRHQQKFENLLPAREVIVELRQRRASFRAIAELLTQHCLPAGKTAIADFCHEVLGETIRPHRRTPRKRLPAVEPQNETKFVLPAPATVALEPPSVEQIQRITDEFGDKCGYVVVRNAAHSDSFTIFETCEVRALLKDKFGALEIGMSRMQDWLVEALNAENLTVTAAAKHSVFSLLDRQRLQTWQRRFYAELESAANLLLPSK